MKWKNYLYILPLLILSACSKFEFDPNQSVDLKSSDRLNFANIDKITHASGNEELTFIVTGDTHLDYENTKRMVKLVNNDKRVDFVIHVGDLTDHGLLKEYEWKTAILQQLNVPYLVAIGNHDIVSRGEDVYKHMYGPTNFSVVIDSVKFIFYNNNGREYDFKGNVPDLSWLEKELTKEKHFTRAVLVSHVPYWDKDYDLGIKPGYLKVINKAHESVEILAAFNGHLHEPTVHESPETPVRHILPGAVNRKTYLKVTITKAELTYENIYF
ncbi:MAG: metallophosphoesterase [Bacteroidota bacterium]